MAQVAVNEGLLEGEVQINEYGGQFYSFKGIPFAEPPVGELRFKSPQPLKPWKGIRATKDFGPICYQVDFALGGVPVGSEDCLYLNVYTPDLKPSKPLPVMFYIHGGAFLSGSGNDDMLGPEFLIRHGVILVTINYRLGALGFLCLDTEDIPGNAGMKDQVAALRWVNKNIKHFGGDPNCVTIFGESAGGGSVSYHLISPMSQGLFSRCIAQSGANTCWWATAFEPRDRALSLAKKYDFYSEDDKELFEFFKSLPLESLVGLNLSNTSQSEKEYADVQFSIVNEKQFGNNERFFYGDVFETLRNGTHAKVDLMTGCTADEGYVVLANLNLQRAIDQINHMNDYLVPKSIAFTCPIETQIKLGKKFKKHYFKNGKITSQDVDKFIKYWSMEMFFYGTIQLAKAWSKQNKVYVYNFSCKSERNFMGHKYLGLKDIIRKKTIVCHSDDLSYLFPMKFGGQRVDVHSETFELIENVTKLWSNFAKYGNPTPDDSLGVKWKPYNISKQEYLDIGNQLVTGSNPLEKEVEFWENIFREYCPQYVM